MTNASNDVAASVRLDKWRWCARFFKTRTLAAEAVRTGKVQVDGRVVKASRSVHAGDQLRVRRGPMVFEITVLQIAASRRSAAAAATLYQESEASIAVRAQLAARMKADQQMYPRNLWRPTKRDRRSLLRFKRQDPP